MISTVEAQHWAAGDLTGNSALVAIGPTLYLAGGRRGDGTQALYRSVDEGRNWEARATFPAPEGSLDPALAVDDQGLIHLVVAQPRTSPDRMDVLRFTYNTVTEVLDDPVILLTGSRTQAAYDILPLEGGASLVVTAAEEPITPEGYAARYVLLAFEVAADRTVTTTALVDQSWDRGDTFGGISLIAPGGSAPVELYYTSHSRSFRFKDTETVIRRASRASSGAWDPPVTLTSPGFMARFTDDKLTVVPTADGRRLVTTAFHRQIPGGVTTSVFYGVGTFDPGAGTWAWRWDTLLATPAWSFREPVIGTDGSTIFLACLTAAWLPADGRYTRDGSLRVYTLDPSTLHPTAYPPPPAPAAWEVLRFKWLRGSKAQVDPASRWRVVGIQGSDQAESGGGRAVYVSELNLPPVAVLTPAAVTLQRGETLTLDASATQDPDLDTLTYTWSHTSPDTTHVHLLPVEGGRRAQLRVDKAIGPLATAFTVAVSVTDPSHPAVTASAAITVPVNAAPMITLVPSQDIPRNTRVTLAATVTDADACTYLWEQVDGTTVELLDATTLTPVVMAYRLDPGGDHLRFRLTVQDGVNPPVTRETSLVVPPIAAEDQDVGLIARAYHQLPDTNVPVVYKVSPLATPPEVAPDENEVGYGNDCTYLRKVTRS